MDNKYKNMIGKKLEALSKYGYSWIFFAENGDEKGGSTDSEES